MAVLSIGAVDQNDQVQMCSSAAQAIARGSPAAPGLERSCQELRAANVAANRLIVDAKSIDGALRVPLASRGETIMASSPPLQAAAAKLPALNRRGFAIGVAVASAQGGYDPAYAAWMAASLGPEDARGFAAATAGIPRGGGPLSASTVKATNPTTPEESGGVPTAVYVGGGLVLAVGIGALVYKFVL